MITGARSEALYQAIEELAGDQTGVELVSKAQAAVSTSKVVLAINSVRKALQARCPLQCNPCSRDAACKQPQRAFAHSSDPHVARLAIQL